MPMFALVSAACSESPGDETDVGSTETLVSSNKPLLVTSTNQAANALLVYDTAGTLVQTVSTSGAGGVAGNAGGVTARDRVVAVVNFGSQSVSLFRRQGDRLHLVQVLPTASPPVSVAIDDEHVYVLGTTTVESHRRRGSGANVHPDGTSALVKSDGSSAQVGILDGELLITEKSGIVEVVTLDDGAVIGPAAAIAIAPEDSNTPLGLVTRGRTGYVTLAHSDEIGLIRDDELISKVATGSDFPTGPGEQAPCWIARSGDFLFTADSPSHAITRLLAGRDELTVDEPVVAGTTGAPTDIAVERRLLGVIEQIGDGTSRLTQYTIAHDGSLAMTVTSAIATAADGIAIVDE